MRARIFTALAYILLAGVHATLAQQALEAPNLRVQVDGANGQLRELLSVKVDGAWQPALSAASSVHVLADAGLRACPIAQAVATEDGLLLSGDCGIGVFEQRIRLAHESGVIDVSTRLELKDGASVNSAEDRYDFLPPRRDTDNEHSGPLDFVWSQNIKSESDDLIPSNGFKSPVVMMQQGSIFAALMPHVNDRHAETRALDLDVTSDEHPWMAYGAIPSQPHDHSYFRRFGEGKVSPIANTVEYEYSIVLSAQPPSTTVL
jgi:hypothetical protein